MDLRKNITTFNPLTDEQATQFLAVHLPPGKLTARRYDNTSYIYKLIYILADFVKQITNQFYTIVKNLDINQTDELLPEQEAAVDIPNIVPRLTTLAQRRAAVIQLRSKIPVYNIGSVYNIPDGKGYSLCPQGWIGDIRTTFENFVYNLTGIKISITLQQNTSSQFPASFPYTFSLPYNLLSSIWIINVHGYSNLGNNSFPTPFPIVFGTSITVPQEIQNILTPVLELVIPSYICYSFNGVI